MRANALCHRDGIYDAAEIAGSTFFATREQTKFAPGERHYPLPQHATARYCFSRGCTGQVAVQWSEDERNRLGMLRATIVQHENPASELRFIKVAVLQLEAWLYARLRRLDAKTVDGIMKRIAAYSSQPDFNPAAWVAGAISSYDRFDKECATYAMEATQHLLVLANLGLVRHWNITAPVYRFGVPGHWTAGLENRLTCERYRFDLNTQASVRFNLHGRGLDPALLALQDSKTYGHLFPGMDGNGAGRPGPERPASASDGSALGRPSRSLEVAPR